MSTTATADPETLRTELIEEIKKMDAEQLRAAKSALAQAEISRLSDALAAECDRLRAEGKLTSESVERSIREHRARHPYR